MRRHLTFASAVLFLLAFSNSAARPQPSPGKVTIGTITLSLNNLPIYVGQDKGLFAKENIFVEAVVLGASTRAIPALIGGSTDMSASSAMTTIRAIVKGAALKIVGGLINAPIYDLIANAKYKSIKELKGTTIGVTGLITSDTVLMKEMLKANGLEYPRDYGMIAIGGTAERWLAMQTVNVSAGILNPPFTFVAEDAGYINLGSTAKYTTSTSRQSTADIGIQKFLGLPMNFGMNDFLNQGAPFSPEVQATYDAGFDGSGTTKRSGELSAVIATRVTDVMSNGNLVLEGRKEIVVNNEQQFIILSGIARPEDINEQNIIPSILLSDARIEYDGKGVVSDEQSPGWMRRILDNVWPF